MTQSDAARRWEERLRRFDQAQTTVTQFCSDEGVSQPSYYHWRRKLRGTATSIRKPASGDEAAAGFAPVAFKAQPSPANHSDRAPTSPARTCTTVELPGGVRITVEVPTESPQQTPSPEARS